MNKLPISLQLWSINQDTKNDFASAVREVAKIGYAGVELAGYGNLTAEGAARALVEAQLFTAGMHVGIERLSNDLDQVIAEAKLFQSPFITCPWYEPKKLETRDQCEKFGEELNVIGEKIRKAGISFSYHNHEFELMPVDGRLKIEWILGASEPRNVGLELDVYWSTFAGVDTCDFIRKQGARIEQIHLKDEKELGASRKVDFEKIFSVVEEIGAVSHYVVEQEEYSYDPLKCVGICFEQLRTWGKA